MVWDVWGSLDGAEKLKAHFQMKLCFVSFQFCCQFFGLVFYGFQKITPARGTFLEAFSGDLVKISWASSCRQKGFVDVNVLLSHCHCMWLKLGFFSAENTDGKPHYRWYFMVSSKALPLSIHVPLRWNLAVFSSPIDSAANPPCM